MKKAVLGSAVMWGNDKFRAANVGVGDSLSMGFEGMGTHSHGRGAAHHEALDFGSSLRRI